MPPPARFSWCFPAPESRSSPPVSPGCGPADQAEAHRREAMSAYVEQESEAFSTGRELQVP